MKAIVALAWLAVLLAASDDTGVVSVVAAAQPAAVRPSRRYAGEENWPFRLHSWPEVVGMSSEEAKKKICEHWTCDYVHVIPAGYGVTMAYDTRRVRVFLDSNDKVATVPRIG